MYTPAALPDSLRMGLFAGTVDNLLTAGLDNAILPQYAVSLALRLNDAGGLNFTAGKNSFLLWNNAGIGSRDTICLRGGYGRRVISGDNHTIPLRCAVRPGLAVCTGNAAGMGFCGRLRFICCMNSGPGLFLDSADGRGLGCGGFDCTVGDMPASHTHQAALEKAGQPGGTGLSGGTASSGTGSTRSGLVSAACYHRHGSHGNHGLGQHGTAGAAYIDPQGRHETVYLLGDFQESNSAQEPDQHISCDGFLAGRRNSGLYLTFFQGKRRSTEHERHQCRQGQQTDNFLLFRVNSSLN